MACLSGRLLANGRVLLMFARIDTGEWNKFGRCFCLLLNAQLVQIGRGSIDCRLNALAERAT
jgi:hypothetical protein